MISLEQIKQLESRVLSAVEKIRSLTTENETLKGKLGDYETRIEELQMAVEGFKSDQAEIEAGIVAALAQLDGLEDSVAEPAQSEQNAPEEIASKEIPSAKKPEPADAPPPETADSAEPATDDEVVGEDEEEPELDIF